MVRPHARGGEGGRGRCAALRFAWRCWLRSCKAAGPWRCTRQQRLAVCLHICHFGAPKARQGTSATPLIPPPLLPLSCSTPQIKPAIYVTYNGDYFDWPFIGGWGAAALWADPVWLGGARVPLVAVPAGLPLPASRCLPAVTATRPSMPRHLPPCALPLPAETRAAKNGMDMAAEIGFTCDRKSNQTLSRCVVCVG